MKTKKIFRNIFVLILMLCISFCNIIPVSAQSIDEIFENIYSANTTIIAEVPEDYPEQYLDVVITDKNGDTVQELRLLYYEMYKKKLTLPQGEYILKGVNLVDSNKFPVETVSFTVDYTGAFVRFYVGPKAIENMQETTTETTVPNAEVVEKETTKRPIEEPTSSLVIIEDPTEENTEEEKTLGEKFEAVGTISIFVIIGLFVLVFGGGAIVFIYFKKKNERF